MTIYLIRHAQSAFNAVHKPNKPDPMIFDAPITELGETQARQARKEIKKFTIRSVIVSPFTRTIQTAQLIFEDSDEYVQRYQNEYYKHSNIHRLLV